MAFDPLGGFSSGVSFSRLPSSMPSAASAMYSRNISALLLYLVKDGELTLDDTDELQAGVIVTSGGAVVHPALAPPAEPDPADPSAPESEEGAARVPGSAS